MLGYRDITYAQYLKEKGEIMFTKKHMEAIASVCKWSKPLPQPEHREGLPLLVQRRAAQLEQWETMVENLASMLYAWDDKFDNQKFFKECNYDGGYRDE